MIRTDGVRKMRELGQRGAATMLVALLVFSIMARIVTSVVKAQDDDEDQEATENIKKDKGIEPLKNIEVEEIEEDREISLHEIDENEVELEALNQSEKDPEEIEDMYRLKISTKDGVDFKLEHTDKLERRDAAVVEREIELEFKVEFDAIMEFVDANGNGLYDKDEEVYEYNLEGAQYASIQTTTENAGGPTVYKITVQTADGVFKVTLYSSGKPVIIDGENVKPNEVKITVEIENFPYSHENSKLALKTEFESEFEVEEEKRGGEDEDEVSESREGYAGFFSWKLTALVDGVEKEVKSTSLEDDPEENDRELYLIYERGNSIAHDPKIGVLGAIGAVPAMPWILVIVAAILATLISIGATKYIVLRRGS